MEWVGGFKEGSGEQSRGSEHMPLPLEQTALVRDDA